RRRQRPTCLLLLSPSSCWEVSVPGLAAFGKSFLYLFPTWQLSLVLGHLPPWYCQEGIWPCPVPFLFVSKRELRFHLLCDITHCGIPA
ncbi:RIKEN cDNA A830059I20, isoform CRA_a, partial [Mus musculus]